VFELVQLLGNWPEQRPGNQRDFVSGVTVKSRGVYCTEMGLSFKWCTPAPYVVLETRLGNEKEEIGAAHTLVCLQLREFRSAHLFHSTHNYSVRCKTTHNSTTCHKLYQYFPTLNERLQRGQTRAKWRRMLNILKTGTSFLSSWLQRCTRAHAHLNTESKNRIRSFVI
jgi:hypothetical protein